MANARRGEVEAVIDGRRRILVLTLGALAELEAAFGAADLMALAERFSAGRLGARDVTQVLAAGLRGAGEAVTLEEVAAMRVEDGAVGCVRLVHALLAATFGREGTQADGPRPPAPPEG